jgi:lysophospholipase L1-like esterase
MSRARSVAASLGLAAASLALLLLLLEVGLRVAAGFDRNDFEALMDQPRVQEDRPLFLMDLLRRHPDDGIVFALRPGTRGRFLGHEVRVNSLGMRGEERARVKPEGTYRVLLLGDSHAFGWGVAEEEALPSVLESMLEARAAGGRVEVLNAGVPGYNAMQEVRSFELLADAVSPDLVLVHYVDNDMDLPNFLARPRDPWSLRGSFLVELLRRRISLLRGWHLAPSGLVAVPPDPGERFRLPEHRIPERYRPLQGWDRMVAAYRRLARLAQDRGIPVAILFDWNHYQAGVEGRVDDVYPDHLRRLIRLCEEAGYLVVDPQERILHRLRQGSLSHQALWVTPDDPHPSVLRHRLLAEEVAARLHQAGLVPTNAP